MEMVNDRWVWLRGDEASCMVEGNSIYIGERYLAGPCIREIYQLETDEGTVFAHLLRDQEDRIVYAGAIASEAPGVAQEEFEKSLADNAAIVRYGDPYHPLQPEDVAFYNCARVEKIEQEQIDA